MSSRARNRRKMQLMVLASFAIALILLVLNIFFLFRMQSLQNQINELKEAKESIKKTEVTGTNAGGAKDGDEQEPQTSTEPQDTAAPEQSPAPSETPDGTGEKYVYLTFDDGPSKNTERILSILEQYDVKATFFVNGREDEDSLARYRKIAEAGHEIAMHSYSHDYAYIYASTDNFIEDLDKIQSLVERITGKKPMVYRFPGGSSNRLSMRRQPMQDFADVLAERGIVYFDWNVDSTDGEGSNLPVSQLIENAKKGLGKTESSVVLMHDANDHDTTVEALPTIIQNCKDMGLKFGVITTETPAVHHTIAD